MLSTEEKIIFAIFAFLSLFLAYRTFSVMIKIINMGKGKLYLNNLPNRIINAITIFVFQKTVFSNRPLTSFFHAFVAWAFMLYFLVNLGDVLEGYISGFHFLGSGEISNIYHSFVDIFSVLAIVSISFLLIRRFIVRSPSLKIKNNIMLYDSVHQGIARDSLVVGFFIFFHVGFRFLGESFKLAAIGKDTWQPFASTLATLWSMLDPASLDFSFHLSWWFAVGLILLFIPYFPHSKHAHLFMGPINYLTKPIRNAHGTMEKLDFEDSAVEQFGVATMTDLDKTQILDAYACIMCHRCQEACPAYITGKQLSPSALEINKRYYINTNLKKFIKATNEHTRFIDFALTESALWACTSCAACVEMCPVGNEPMFDILNIRRDRVLMEAKFPSQLQNAFNGMERNGNPWNMNKDRLEWTREDPSLTVKTVDDNPTFEILYWVGCAGAFDLRGQKISRAFTKILNRANVNFAILGNRETCTGDSARRTGNEYLFSIMAQSNVETLNKIKAKKIVTTCPHCLHTLKNEYPQFDGHYEVTHHSQLIHELIRSNKLKFNKGTLQTVTYHDPCYLGRHNGIFDDPRKALPLTGVSLQEMKRIRNHSFCCGAGGGNMWKEEEEGQNAVRRERFNEAISSGAEALATACPFCLTMLRDAGNELESHLQVYDIAEIIADRIS